MRSVFSSYPFHRLIQKDQGIQSIQRFPDVNPRTALYSTTQLQLFLMDLRVITEARAPAIYYSISALSQVGYAVQYISRGRSEVNQLGKKKY